MPFRVAYRSIAVHGIAALGASLSVLSSRKAPM
jgi:hypothetical protein